MKHVYFFYCLLLYAHDTIRWIEVSMCTKKRMYNIKNVRYACWILRRHIKPRQLFQKKAHCINNKAWIDGSKILIFFSPFYRIFIYCFSGAVYVQKGVVFFIVWKSIVFLLIPLCYALISGKSPLRNVEEILQNNIKYHYRK
jgi:hypothetical protein